MAKKKKGSLQPLFKVLTLVFCALVVLSFFLPVFSANKDYELYDENSKTSSACLVFVSAEKATEKQEELLKQRTKGEITTEEYQKQATEYLLIASLKDQDFEEKSLVAATAWLHFIAAVLALCCFVIIALSFLGISLDKFAKFVLAGSTLLLIISLILGLSFLGKETTLKQTYGTYYVLGFGGVILGLISSAIACVASFLASPCKKAKK